MKNNIEIEFFLAPYAPLVYNTIKKEHPMVLKVENLIRAFALSQHVKIYGSFNPTILGMDETFFYDGMHCKEIGIEKILNLKI